MEDEFSFIRSITPKKHNHQITMGIGDDAARYRPQSGKDQLICTDTMVEGVHFLRETMSPYAVGWKALASNLSDIAAMGGVPDFYLVSAAFSEEWFADGKEVYRGMADLANHYHLDLIGGDTVSSPEAFVLSVTVIGHAPDKRTFLRREAKPGDILMVTGTLGDSAAGLSILQKKLSVDKKNMDYLVRRHQLPKPRLDAAELIRRLPCRAALNDISDGLASESSEIAEASHVSLVIDRDQLPVSQALLEIDQEQRLNFILYGGEDYQLLMAVPREAAEHYRDVFAENHLLLSPIGEVVDAEGEPGVFLKEADQIRRLTKSGYNHFRK
ncbi:thiamine-phosphate kinase [Sporolactobacillus sp. THM7-4]|nr:thiamine-phosphate kinase [Sporolactobacillus sp. THM7-4]